MRRRLSKLPTTRQASRASAPSERRHKFPAQLRTFAGSARACWRARSAPDKLTLHPDAPPQLVPACARPAFQTFHADTGPADNRARFGSIRRALAVRVELKAGAGPRAAKDELQYFRGASANGRAGARLSRL